jgi:hypothetical protein
VYVHHFRIATSGGVNVHNVHPFYIVKDKIAFCHNGILPINVPRNSIDSDTRIFNDYVLQMIRPDALTTPLIKDIIEEWIATDKLALLFDTGEYEIYNEKEGEWSGGCWFSNEGYLYETHYVYGENEHENLNCHYCGADLRFKIERETGSCYICTEEQMWKDYTDAEGEMDDKDKLYYEVWYEEYNAEAEDKNLPPLADMGKKYALGFEDKEDVANRCTRSDSCEICENPCEIGYEIASFFGESESKYGYNK